MSVTSVTQDHKKMKIAIAICWVLALLPAAPMWFTSEKMWNDERERCDFPFRDKIWVWTAASLAHPSNHRHRDYLGDDRHPLEKQSRQPWQGDEIGDPDYDDHGSSDYSFPGVCLALWWFLHSGFG